MPDETGPAADDETWAPTATPWHADLERRRARQLDWITYAMVVVAVLAAFAIGLHVGQRTSGPACIHLHGADLVIVERCGG